MTLTAPRSRRGGFVLVLAILAALVAVSGALLLGNNAQAQLPDTTVELDQAPDSPTPGTVAPGGAVTYEAEAILTLGLSGTDELTIEVDFDTDLGNPVVTCTPAADASAVVGTTQAYCNWDDPVGAGTYETQVDGIATDDLAAPSGRVCADTNGDNDCDEETGTDEIAMDDDSPADTGALTLDASGLATLDPASATNPPGTSHVLTATLQAAVNCASGDAADPTDNETDVTCDASDVALSCAGGSVDSVVVTNSGIGVVTTVTITISNDGTEETCTVTLSLVANSGNDVPGDDVPFTVDAEKEYTLAAIAGELRHLDEPDPATEDAFGDYADGGLLIEMDDPDDAIGSFHQACIVNVLDPASPGLTNADAPDITWDIEPIIGASPVAASVTEVAGPNGEACVRWGSAYTGAQQITATWDNGVAPAVTFYWDSYCVEGDTCYDADDGSTTDVVPLELVKEWNTIDYTKIVAADGDVGDTLDDNTGQLDLNPSTQRDATLHQNANVDGTTVDVEGVLIIGPAGFGHVDADGTSFVEYVFGAHNDAGGFYSGPVDGVEQTFSVSGDCGSVRLEDPVTGNVIILSPGDEQTLLSSDKGIGFEVVPNDNGAIETTPANADCDPSSSLTVSIHSEEHELFRSPPAVVLDPDEEITVHWTVGPPTNKQPILLWAGMRYVLEHDWSDANGDCPWGENFLVRYTIQTGNGALVSDLGDGIAFGPDFMIVEVGGVSAQTAGGQGSNPDGANTDCISRVVYESQDEGEQDIVAHVVEPLCPLLDNFGSVGEFEYAGCDFTVVSQQVPFLLYYMKFESVTLGIVPGSRTGHNDGDFDPDTEPVWDPTNDVTDYTANVSADVLARVKVRGWLVRNNCPVRDAGEDSNGSFLPENRCIFPDDWEHIAGGVLAEEFRPNYDIMNAPDSSYNCTGANYLTCNSSQAPGVVGSTVTGHNPVRGPFSLLDGPNPGDSVAPNVTGGFRETWLHDGDVDEWDAPMPPALIRFLLTGSGFLRAADKKSVYDNGENPFYETHIPAEPWITPINEDLSGYQWNTWGIGSKSGPYVFWTSLADHSAEVISCPGATPCAGSGVATGGYKMTRVYTDNHGEAMTYVNGDADLTWADCDLNTPVPAYNISQLSGYYCEQGDVVGNSTLDAVADYPDKRKHQPIASEEVTITWTWGGIKNVTIEPGAGDGFNYVVFHVSDRDGFCDLTTSLHPVLGELVEFTIDSPNGIIFPDSNGIEAQGPPVTVSASKKFASTHTFAVSATECQAWIHVSESQELPVDVIIRAFDPEGTVTFDVLINEPPEPTPTPSPTPAPPPDLWGDIDCDGDVDSVDALGGLRYVAGFFVNQTGPCSDVGSSVDVDGNTEIFGDWDCDGDVDAVDALQILLWVAGLDGDQTPPCPDIGSGVTIT